jgi:hypothetical protein
MSENIGVSFSLWPGIDKIQGIDFVERGYSVERKKRAH